MRQFPILAVWLGAHWILDRSLNPIGIDLPLDDYITRVLGILQVHSNSLSPVFPIERFQKVRIELAGAEAIVAHEGAVEWDRGFDSLDDHLVK